MLGTPIRHKAVMQNSILSMHFFNSLNIFLVLVLAIGLCGCQAEPRLRTYEEIVIPPAEPEPSSKLPAGHPDISNLPPGHPDITGTPVTAPVSMAGENDGVSWDTPDGWQALAGTGMRVATFLSAEETAGEAAFEATITALGPEAGDLHSNAVRWLGQLNIASPDPDKLAAFLDAVPEVKTAGGDVAVILDFTSWVESPDDPGMLAAVIKTPDRVLFVKLTAAASVADQERSAFMNLVASVSAK